MIESFWVGLCFGLVAGSLAGFMLAALMVAARDGSEPQVIHWTAYEQGRYACREQTGHNPYLAGSVPFESWKKGYADQLEGVRPE